MRPAELVNFVIVATPTDVVGCQSVRLATEKMVPAAMLTVVYRCFTGAYLRELIKNRPDTGQTVPDSHDTPQ